MRVDFYRIEGPAGAATLRSLQHVLSLANDESRTKDISDIPYRAQELILNDSIWRGDLVKIRMNDLPRIVSRDGETEEIAVNDDQGIGEDVAFVYDQITQVLAIQRNMYGASASRWGAYFQSFLPEGAAIIPVVVPTRATMDDVINRLNVVKKVHIRIAGHVPAALAFDPNHNTSGQIRQLAQGAHVLEMTLGMGRLRQSLPIEVARQTLSAMYNFVQQNVLGRDASIERIDVVGTFAGEEKSKAFDLLDYFVREDVDVPVNEAARRMLYADRQRGVDEAWGRRSAELRERYTPRARA